MRVNAVVIASAHSQVAGIFSVRRRPPGTSRPAVCRPGLAGLSVLTADRAAGLCLDRGAERSPHQFRQIRAGGWQLPAQSARSPATVQQQLRHERLPGSRIEHGRGSARRG